MSAGQKFSSPLLAACDGPFFVVFNAGSGHRDADEDRQIISRIFREGGRDFEFLEASEAAPLELLARRAVALVTARKGVVVAAGGDGTLNAVANAVLGSGCPFGVLPQGTFNYFAREHAIFQDTEKSARALLDASVSPVQVGRVNGRLFLVNASVGLYLSCWKTAKPGSSSGGAAASWHCSRGWQACCAPAASFGCRSNLPGRRPSCARPRCSWATTGCS